MILFSEATKEDAKIVRAIAKKHGIKKCKISSKSVFIGSQLEVIEKSVAIALIKDLKIAGYASDIQEIIDMVVDQNNLCGLAVKKFKTIFVV